MSFYTFLVGLAVAWPIAMIHGIDLGRRLSPAAYVEPRWVNRARKS